MHDGFSMGNLFYIFHYFGITSLAIYFFIHAGDNPGFVDET